VPLGLSTSLAASSPSRARAEIDREGSRNMFSMDADHPANPGPLPVFARAFHTEEEEEEEASGRRQDGRSMLRHPPPTPPIPMLERASFSRFS
jgi:hypothetical protein